MAQNETTSKDLGYDNILKELKKLESNPFVKVGLPQDGADTNASREGGFTNLDIAMVQEFGTEDGSIPERSHVRAAFDENKKKLNKLTDVLAGKIMDGKETVENALNKIGILKVSNIQKKIRTGLTPAVKRGGTPLLNTGQYVGSFTYTKVMNGEGEQ